MLTHRHATPTVLLVDDDPVSLALLEAHLGGHDLRILTASSAEEAMGVVSGTPVQIVIADWVMPGVSGLDLCRWVRSRTFAGPLHFVILTVHSETDRLTEAFAAGVDDFLSKPLDESELLARLRAWTRFVRLQEDLDARHREAARLNGELAAANARLAELATRDELTRLPNRREAVRCLDQQWAVHRRYGRPLACAMVDVDRFKWVNDTYGHPIGDDVLRHVAAALRRDVRDADAVFRLGGDEFLILLPDCDAAAAAACAERCRRAVCDRPVGPAGVPCTVSIGIAQASNATAGPHDLLRAADEALYAAKRAGRNVARAAG
ncbi:MAG TPA: diguanylate cyclase [Tepidisphaeraceae bacterium]|nr:diguanylate cyclase [Tepidisphaeraceae bacterium]